MTVIFLGNRTTLFFKLDQYLSLCQIPDQSYDGKYQFLDYRHGDENKIPSIGAINLDPKVSEGEGIYGVYA